MKEITAPLQTPVITTESIRQALTTAKRLVGMLQATMALETQGLDKQFLKNLTKRKARAILRHQRETQTKERSQ
jgi:hypothetical protein